MVERYSQLDKESEVLEIIKSLINGDRLQALIEFNPYIMFKEQTINPDFIFILFPGSCKDLDVPWFSYFFDKRNYKIEDNLELAMNLQSDGKPYSIYRDNMLSIIKKYNLVGKSIINEELKLKTINNLN